DRAQYDREIAGPIGTCLKHNQLTEQILYIVTTGGVPLKISGREPEGPTGDYASVDSELTMLYSDLKQGKAHPIAGPLGNPFFGKREAKFAHPEFPIYLVTRLPSPRREIPGCGKPRTSCRKTGSSSTIRKK